MGTVLLLILSDIRVNTSLYKYEDNSVLISFPRWQPAHPWGTLHWQAGRLDHHWYGVAGKPKEQI